MPGKKIVLSGSPFWIVGVAQRGFSGTAVGYSPDMFIPIMMIKQTNASVRQWNTRHMCWLNVLGRLKPGVNMSQGGAATNVLFEQIEQNDPERKPAPSYDKDPQARNRATLLPMHGSRSGPGHTILAIFWSSRLRFSCKCPPGISSRVTIQRAHLRTWLPEAHSLRSQTTFILYGTQEPLTNRSTIGHDK